MRELLFWNIDGDNGIRTKNTNAYLVGMSMGNDKKRKV
jgi:hypothetical protein